MSRLGTLDVGRYALRKRHIAALLEIDVTDAIAAVRSRRGSGRAVSLFSWMVKAISEAIEENPYVHALEGRRCRTVVFEDIDVSAMVAKTVDGRRVPLPLLIRQTNAKSVEAIHSEIQATQRQGVRDAADYVLAGEGPGAAAMRLFYALPQGIRLLLLRLLLRSPHRSKTTMGTVMITSVGTPGRQVRGGARRASQGRRRMTLRSRRAARKAWGPGIPGTIRRPLRRPRGSEHSGRE